MTGASSRVWTVRVPQPAPWLTANIDSYRYRRAVMVRAWRRATVTACYAMQLPHGITPVTISAVICYASTRPPVRDRLNLAPTMKAVVDALTPPRTIHRKEQIYRTHGYGLLPDDDDRHILATTWELRPDRWDGIVLTITAAVDAVEQQPLFDIHNGRS